MNKLLLPTGEHYGAYIDNILTQTGPFTGGGWKIVLHTTEGGWSGSDTTVRRNGVQPHFLLDPTRRRIRQYIRLNQFAKCLRHPSGTPETNRANAIQIEIVGYADHVDSWGTTEYKSIAALCCLIEHRRKIVRKAPYKFSGGKSYRCTGNAFVSARGYLGHCHVPNNDHYDPGLIDIDRVFHWMPRIDKFYA